MDKVIIPLVFGCVFLLVLGISTVLDSNSVRRRLARLSSKTPVPQVQQQSLVRAGETGLMRFFRRLGERRQRQKVGMGQFRARFIRAGISGPAAPAIFYGIRFSLALGLPMISGLFPVVWGLPPSQQILLVCTLAAFGYVGPGIYLDRLVANRKSAMTRSLPDALDLMVVCVEAGLGINQSLARVAKEFRGRSPVLSSEFALVANETRAGKTIIEALHGLADRTGVSDVSSLVALLVQTERFGTSVAHTLRVHADSMRIRRMHRAEERAQTATLKLILPSTLIFVALLLIFMAPGMYRFFGAFDAIK